MKGGGEFLLGITVDMKLQGCYICRWVAIEYVIPHRIDLEASHVRETTFVPAYVTDFQPVVINEQESARFALRELTQDKAASGAKPEYRNRPADENRCLEDSAHAVEDISLVGQNGHGYRLAIPIA
jgi:hypothetical protein